MKGSFIIFLVLYDINIYLDVELAFIKFKLLFLFQGIEVAF